MKRFHATSGLYSNKLQETSKCVTNISGILDCVQCTTFGFYHVLTSSVICYSTDVRQQGIHLSTVFSIGRITGKSFQNNYGANQIPTDAQPHNLRYSSICFLNNIFDHFSYTYKKGLRIRHIFNRRFQIISGTLNMIPHTDVIRLFPMIHDYLRRVFIFVSQVVGEALLWTLQDMLQSKCTSQVLEAWTELFKFITKTMLGGIRSNEAGDEK